MLGWVTMFSSDGRRGRLNRRHLLRAASLAGASGLVLLPGASTGHAVPASGTGLAGRAVDLATFEPVPGAVVEADPLGVRTETDRTGSYILPLPPGTYTVRVRREGFLGVIRREQSVSGPGYTSVDLSLVPRTPTASQQATLYHRMVTQHQAPPVARQALLSPQLSLTTMALPSEIQVYYDQYDGANPPYSVWVPLEDYVKGVVPNEMPASWPTEALKAQAVAARSYGVASFLANGFVYPDQRSQVYNPNNEWPSTNAAVDATQGQVLTVNGSVIFAFFFAECNGITTRNSEDAIGYTGTNSDGQYVCTTAGWNYVSYCRARSCTWNGAWSGSTCGYFGHGVGMCQWGSFGQAQNGASYASILNSYYTGVTLSGVSLILFGPFLVEYDRGFTLTWSSVAGASSYQSTISQNGSVLLSYSGSAPGWAIPAYSLTVGSYSWTVTVQTSGGSGPSASATLVVAPKVYNLDLPLVAG